MKIKIRFWKKNTRKFREITFENERELLDWIDTYGQYYDIKKCENK